MTDFYRGFDSPRRNEPTPGASPPRIFNPGNTLNTVKRGTALAVIQSVDNANAPQYATVLVNNKTPGEMGYTIPFGMGPFAAPGTAGFSYFYNDPTTNVGGTIVYVDLDKRAVINATGNVSTTAPTPYYKVITDHQHAGTLVPPIDGVSNPQPIDLGAGQSQNNLPYPQHAPVIQSNIDPSGQNLATDFDGVVEANPGTANAGYEIVPGSASATVVSWEKSGVIHSVVQGPLLYQMSGFCDITNGVPDTTIGIVFLADSNPPGQDPLSSGYLVQWINNSTIAIWRMSSGTWSRMALGNASNPTTPNEHTLKVLVQYANGTLIIQAYADTSQLVWVDTSPLRTSGFYGIRTDNNKFFMRSFEVSQSQADAVSVTGPSGAAPQKNLVVNGNCCNGDGGIVLGVPVPAQFGWTQSFNNGGIVANVDAKIGMKSYAGVGITIQSTANSGGYQDIPVVGGQFYTYCVSMRADVGSQGRLWIGSTDFATQYNNTPFIPTGTLGVFYSKLSADGITGVSGVNVLAGQHTTTQSNTFQVAYGSFQVPTGTSVARVLLQNLGSNVGNLVTFHGIMVYPGLSLQDYIDHELNPQGVSLDRHVIGYTSAFAQNIATLWNALPTDCIVHFNSSGGSGSISVWVDNGSPSTNISVYAPYQTTPWQTIPFVGTSAAPWQTYTSLTNGNTYYFLIWYNFSTGWNILGPQSSQMSASQCQQARADGIFSVLADTTINSIVVGSGSITHQGGGGSGGTHPQ